jgi:hypothetical protein
VCRCLYDSVSPTTSSFFLFYLVPLKFTLTILNFRVVLSFIDISTLIHNLLFIIFVLRSFVKFWFVFNNNLESIIVICFFFLIWSSFFWFWLFILNPFMNLIFIFDFPLQFKILICPLFYFFISNLVIIFLIVIFFILDSFV